MDKNLKEVHRRKAKVPKPFFFVAPHHPTDLLKKRSHPVNLLHINDE
jgi:hypothetical protein